MKTVNGFKDVFTTSRQDEQRRMINLLCLDTEIFLFYLVQSYAVKTLNLRII